MRKLTFQLRFIKYLRVHAICLWLYKKHLQTAFVCCLGLLLLGIETFQEEEWSSSDEVTSVLCVLGVTNWFCDLSFFPNWKQSVALVLCPCLQVESGPVPSYFSSVPNTTMVWKTILVVWDVLFFKTSNCFLGYNATETSNDTTDCWESTEGSTLHLLQYDEVQTRNHALDLEAREYFSARFPGNCKGGTSDQVTNSSMLGQESSGLQAENRADFFLFFSPLETAKILGCFLPLMWNCEHLGPSQFWEKNCWKKAFSYGITLAWTEVENAVNFMRKIVLWWFIPQMWRPLCWRETIGTYPVYEKLGLDFQLP